MSWPRTACWQMDFYRRVGAGRLSEVLGDATIDTDPLLRTVGLRRAADQELAALPAAIRRLPCKLTPTA